MKENIIIVYMSYLMKCLVNVFKPYVGFGHNEFSDCWLTLAVMDLWVICWLWSAMDFWVVCWLRDMTNFRVKG